MKLGKNNKMGYWLGIITIIAVMSLVMTIVTAQANHETNRETETMSKTVYGGQWTCIAKECVKYVQGDEWVLTFCSLENDSATCKISIDGQQIDIPLNKINRSSVKSCSKYECATEVFIRGKIMEE